MVAFLAGAGLMRQKIPEQLEIVAEVPRNAAGKIQKQLLRERFAGGLRALRTRLRRSRPARPRIPSSASRTIAGTIFALGFAREKNRRTVIGPTIRSAARLRSVSAGISPRATPRSSARISGWRRERTTRREQLHELGVVRQLAREARHDRAERRRDEHLEVAAQHPLEIGDEVARVGLLEPGQLAERLDHERQLRGPAAIDRRLADAGAARDALDGEARVADLDQQLERGVEDRAVRLLAARAPRAGARRVWELTGTSTIPILYVSLLNSPRYVGWTLRDRPCMLRARRRAAGGFR